MVRLNFHHSDEAKEKLHNAHKGKRYSPDTEFKKGLIPWNKGKTGILAKNSDQWRKRMSESQKGRVVSDETRLKISNSLKGHIQSKESKLKISKTRIQKYRKSHKTADGYIILGTTRNKKPIFQHHYNWCVANQFLIIPKGCCVHHINGIKDDNRPENLALLPIEHHNVLHWAIRKGEVM